MELYKLPIETAFIIFPFVAFILTIPFLLHQYRKYGAVPILKASIFYSLILYLICAYFLVILPLPSIKSVKALTTPTIQPTLFKFIKDILSISSFEIKEIQDIIKIFKQPTVYTILFNVVLTLPFGVYLRYFYNKNLLKTTFYTFLLSLFFELTQLSGLYGIYPRPYRLFDVDDLLINTLGGLMGYLITPVFTKFLPTKEELEEKSYLKGTKVTLLRRLISFFIDLFFLLILITILRLLTYSLGINPYCNIISLIIYYVFLPLLLDGCTLGKKILHLKIVGITTERKYYNYMLRYFIFSFFTIFPHIWINHLDVILPNPIINRISKIITIYQFINIIFYIYSKTKGQNIFLYEKLTNTKNISTIKNMNV